MFNFSTVSNKSFFGKILRFSLKFVPPGIVVPILQGKLKGNKWIVGAGDNHGYWLGSYEYAMQRVFSKIIKPGSVVYDIGANVGFYTLLASKLVGKQGRVFAFEPLAENIFYIKKHVRINLCNNVMIIEVAVSERNAAVFFQEGVNSAEGTISPSGKRQVKAKSLDRMYAMGEILPPDYIKVDIEGGELSALLGSRELISKYYPTIFLSTHGADMHKKCCSLLQEIGYDVQSSSGNTCINETRELVAVRM